jgi:hypothetical protein
VISLAGSVVIALDILGADSATLRFLEETKESTSEWARFDTVEIKVPAAGAGIGKLKKHALLMKHSNCSGSHATIFPDHFVDTSSNGMFVSLRNAEQYESKYQSGWVEFGKNNRISVFDYELQVE